MGSVNYLTIPGGTLQDHGYERYNYPGYQLLGQILNIGNFMKIAYCNQDDVANVNQYQCGTVNINPAGGAAHNYPITYNVADGIYYTTDITFADLVLGRQNPPQGPEMIPFDTLLNSQGVDPGYGNYSRGNAIGIPPINRGFARRMGLSLVAGPAPIAFPVRQARVNAAWINIKNRQHAYAVNANANRGPVFAAVPAAVLAPGGVPGPLTNAEYNSMKQLYQTIPYHQDGRPVVAGLNPTNPLYGPQPQVAPFTERFPNLHFTFHNMAGGGQCHIRFGGNQYHINLRCRRTGLGAAGAPVQRGTIEINGLNEVGARIAPFLKIFTPRVQGIFNFIRNAVARHINNIDRILYTWNYLHFTPPIPNVVGPAAPALPALVAAELAANADSIFLGIVNNNYLFRRWFPNEGAASAWCQFNDIVRSPLLIPPPAPLAGAAANLYFDILGINTDPHNFYRYYLLNPLPGAAPIGIPVGYNLHPYLNIASGAAIDLHTSVVIPHGNGMVAPAPAAPAILFGGSNESDDNNNYFSKMQKYQDKFKLLN